MGPILGIIPARGGSKSIPRKNIAPFFGKPLIACTIEEARRSKRIERLIVSTDDEEIAEVARAYHAEVPFLRPKEFATDFATDLQVFQHALQWLKEKEGYEPEIVVHLRPTSPLRRAEDIDKGIALLIKSGADSVRSVTPIKEHPEKMWRLTGDHLSPFLFKEEVGEPYNMPRQKLAPLFIQNGSVDVMWARTILEKKSMTGEDIRGFVMNPLVSVNVNDAVDLLLAELLLTRRNTVLTKEA